MAQNNSSYFEKQAFASRNNTGQDYPLNGPAFLRGLRNVNESGQAAKCIEKFIVTLFQTLEAVSRS